VLGLDPGPSRSAWALIEGTQLPRGSTSYLARGSLVGQSDAQSYALRLGAKYMAPRIVVVEAVEGFAFAATSKRGGGQAVVRALMQTSRMVGELVREAKTQGYAVTAITASRARTRVFNRGNIQNGPIKAQIGRLIRGWPEISNEHERDAAVAALACLWSIRGEEDIHRLVRDGAI
jgi:Holliday junction resolvasome RuvABC endonuclease subunit